ncbi:MAG TPA: SRPBCC family protein [Candidatus Acidoferrales bacterium]|nr:SRPBCC family protein [Candidatus Acidoferrales bacterium]
MKTETFVRRSEMEASAEDVYAWHASPGALEKLTPPGEPVKIISKSGGIERGARVELEVGNWPLRQRWVAMHGDFEVGRFFTDEQVSGPFAYWKHRHTFEPLSAATSILEDRVEYALPFGFLGRWFGGWFARRKLEKLFRYRHEVTAREVGSR